MTKSIWNLFPLDKYKIPKLDIFLVVPVPSTTNATRREHLLIEYSLRKAKGDAPGQKLSDTKKGRKYKKYPFSVLF